MLKKFLKSHFFSSRSSQLSKRLLHCLEIIDQPDIEKYKPITKLNIFKSYISGKQRSDELFDQGILYQRHGNYAQALGYYREVIFINPHHICAHFNTGVLLLRFRDWDLALHHFLELSRITPHLPYIDANIASLYSKKNLHKKALHYFLRAIIHDVDSHQIHALIGATYYQLGNLVNAIKHYQAALIQYPNNPEVQNNIGLTYLSLGEIEKAINHLEKAIRLKKNFNQAHNNLGIAYRENCQLFQAEHEFINALALVPNNADTTNNLGTVYLDQGRVSKAEEHFRQALNLNPEHVLAHSNLLLTLNYDNRYDPVTIFQFHKDWAVRHTNGLRIRTLRGARCTSSGRLKIGYVSPDFRSHPVAYLIEPIIAAHNRNNFDIYCYYNASYSDLNTERLRKNVSYWRSIFGLNDETAAELIERDGIDILVDLAGHTCGHRLTLMAMKPAPVQITYLGYPNTTGIPNIEFRITDTIADPKGSEKYFVENLIRLPRCFLCYQPPLGAPSTARQYFRDPNRLIFGSFNHAAKITSEVVKAWCEILSRVPNSILKLKNRSLKDVATREYVGQLFQNHNVETNRIVFLDWTSDIKDHFSAYDDIDVALDTFPYNGTTTTFEALWMGVPVITLSGNSHASRVGHSILASLGHGHLVTFSTSEYIDKAVDLANDSQQINLYRRTLRSKLTNSLLMDNKNMASCIENAYIDAYHTSN